MSRFADTPHDQTNPEVLMQAALEATPESGRVGTGVFVMPNPAEVGAIQSVYVPDLSYEDAKARADGCVCFKWIPHAVADIKEIERHKRENLCSNFCPSPTCGPSGSICACVAGGCYI